MTILPIIVLCLTFQILIIWYILPTYHTVQNNWEVWCQILAWTKESPGELPRAWLLGPVGTGGSWVSGWACESPSSPAPLLRVCLLPAHPSLTALLPRIDTSLTWILRRSPGSAQSVSRFSFIIKLPSGYSSFFPVFLGFYKGSFFICLKDIL